MPAAISIVSASSRLPRRNSCASVASTGCVWTAPRTMRASSTTPPASRARPPPRPGSGSRSSRAGAACGTSSSSPRGPGRGSRSGSRRAAWPGRRCRRGRRAAATGMRRSPRGPTSVTSAPSAIITGAVSEHDSAQHLSEPGATRQIVAVLLHAVADRRAPELGLVVVVAARVHAEVAADGARVAQRRRGDEAGRPRDRGPAAPARPRARRRRSAWPWRPAAARRWPRSRACPSGRAATPAPSARTAAASCSGRGPSRPPPPSPRARGRPASRGLARVRRRQVPERRQPHHARCSCAKAAGAAARAAGPPPSRDSGTSGICGAPVAALERGQHLLGRDRHLVDAHAERVEERVRHRRDHGQQRALAALLARRRAPRGRASRPGSTPPAASRAWSGSCSRACDGILCRPLRKTCSSISASPRPM